MDDHTAGRLYSGCTAVQWLYSGCTAVQLCTADLAGRWSWGQVVKSEIYLVFRPFMNIGESTSQLKVIRNIPLKTGSQNGPRFETLGAPRCSNRGPI